MSEERENILFEEVQRFQQIWIWIILAPVICLQWIGAYQQLVRGKPFGTNPASNGGMLASFLIIGIGIPILFIMLKLITRVEKDGVYVRFYPLHRGFVKIPFEEIDKFEARKYSPIGEYWGWGIRYSKGSKAYTVSGNQGVDLSLVSGKKILIGSNRAEAFETAIRQGKSEASH